MTEPFDDTIVISADIVRAFVGNNSLPAAELPALIRDVHAAVAQLGQPAPPPTPEATTKQGAVGERASIKPDHLVSMIDGKPYKTLRRHLTRHGYTPETYRAAFGLKPDYPMVAAGFAEQRRAIAKKIGLGRKKGGAA